jgi:prevent-host-death family protein
MEGRRVSATEARVRFGELIRQAVEQQEPVFVERGGVPMVVVLAMQSYERLVATGMNTSRAAALQRLAKLRRALARRRGRRKPPDVLAVLRQAREERDERLLRSLR